VRTYSIGPRGEVDDLPFDTKGLPAGLWSFVFQSSTNGYQSIIYFKILKP